MKTFLNVSTWDIFKNNKNNFEKPIVMVAMFSTTLTIKKEKKSYDLRKTGVAVSFIGIICGFD